MSRNAESHFSVNPVNIDIGRSRFERPQNHSFTANVGDLVPFYWTEILPGDTVSMKTSKVVRTSTLLDPVMANLYLDCYYFFVPMRLVWNHTREFFGENTSGPWYPQSSYTIPQFKTTSNSGTIALQSPADYMGLPVGVTGLSVSVLPLRAYDQVYYDWFMDQNLETPPLLPKNDTDQGYNALTPGGVGYACYKACKLHDYFTSSLPAPQRGPAVAVPLTGTVPINITTGGAHVVGAGYMHSMGYQLQFGDGSSDAEKYWYKDGIISGTTERQSHFDSNPNGDGKITYSNLIVNGSSFSGTVNLAGASPVTVNDLRMAFQMQKWYEKSALYGGRYIEMLKAQFGVTSPDARLQRSEYLGGNRVPLQVHQVENNTAGTTPLGHLGAYSATSDYNDDFTHSFTEHGFLLGICVARYPAVYAQGIERAWSRKTMFDYYFPVMANIGNMAVLSKEIYCDGTSADDNVFGYQEAWADYRYSPDRVSALMRPGVSGSLASWNYADYYTSRPTLDADWIKVDKTNVDRTLAVTSAAAPQLICDFRMEGVFVRAMPLYSVPGLIDHH